jgi:hypothetical protein
LLCGGLLASANHASRPERREGVGSLERYLALQRLGLWETTPGGGNLGPRRH